MTVFTVTVLGFLQFFLQNLLVFFNMSIPAHLWCLVKTLSAEARVRAEEM